MPEHAYPRISVQNFGPVRHADIELKPLTLLIGPNNTGKTYVAQLVFALWKAASGKLWRRYSSAPSWTDFLEQQRQDSPERLSFDRLPSKRQAVLRTSVERYQKALENDVTASLQRYFNTQDLGLLRFGADGNEALVAKVFDPAYGDPFLQLQVHGGEPKVAWASIAASLERTSVPNDPTLIGSNGGESTEIDPLTGHLWLQLLAMGGLRWRHAFYLPAGRSGIIHALEALTSAAVNIAYQQAGIDSMFFPALPGVPAEFLQVTSARLLANTPREEAPEAMLPALNLLHDQLLRGKVTLDEDAFIRLGMVYEGDTVRLPVQRASSMVSELAPLDIWLSQIVRPGDLLIIDEPEAHLHPEKQRLIARVLVRLVNAGVHVIATTHSSLILHQVSNCILAARASDSVQMESGLTRDDALSPDNVGVYLFQPDKMGTRVSPVEIEPDWGIAEDEFLRVAEAIGDETYRLASAIDDVVDSRS